MSRRRKSDIPIVEVMKKSNRLAKRRETMGEDSKYDTSTLGGYLTYARDKKGLTQTTVAKLVGVSRKHISILEGNKQDPSYEVLCKLANVLELNPYKLLNMDAPIDDVKFSKDALETRLSLAQQCNPDDFKEWFKIDRDEVIEHLTYAIGVLEDVMTPKK